MKFEWDLRKNHLNMKKHGIDFETAALVFGDENRIEKLDDLHSFSEERYITIGSINGFITVIVVVYCDRGDVIRIISARKANAKEREVYYGKKIN